MSTITVFQSVLKGLPRTTFNHCVARHHADKNCKRFYHWNHLLAMVYAQLSGVSSLRTLEAAFNSHDRYHSQLHTGLIHRTTLAKANETRTGAVFEDTAAWLMGKVSRKLRQRSALLLHLLDSTSMTLKGREFDRWTFSDRNRNTQGIKLHVLFDPSSLAPLWYEFSPPNVNDVIPARQVALQPGTLYVFDKGYCDYNWWAQIDEIGSRFVTRFKSNAGLKVVKKLKVQTEAKGFVLHDKVVQFKQRQLSSGRINEYQKPLRRVTIRRPDNTELLVLATNDMGSSALEIAQFYKKRWGIELFFKWLKQHLKIKTFFGRSQNAVRIQIVTALIAYLLMVLYKHKHGLSQTLWHCLSLTCTTLFEPVRSTAELAQPPPLEPPASRDLNS
jgi:putative transposase